MTASYVVVAQIKHRKILQYGHSGWQSIICAQFYDMHTRNNDNLL